MLKLFLIGETQTPTFQRLLAALGEFAPTDETPDFVLFFREYPGQYTVAQVAEVKRRFPITPLLSVEASLCEGESRTGKPLAGVHSVMWYDFLAQWPREREAWRTGKPTVWSQPEMAGADTLALAALDRDEVFDVPPRTLAISSDDYAYFSFLRDIFRWPRTFWVEKEPIFDTPDILFFDFPDFTDATKQHFLEMQTCFPKARWVAFVAFPRIDEWLWLESRGVTGIFPKPFRINDLRYFLSESKTVSLKIAKGMGFHDGY
ncbi:MAG: hypothetical protein Q4D98_14005 [Planctomycetia bacterium]|nr:hypothetical protein [Planctomycetia bacterium]